MTILRAVTAESPRDYPDPSWYLRRVHQLFAIGHYALIVDDVAAYVRDAGWADEATPYMAFLAALTHWRLHEPAAAEALLSQVAASLASASWPAAITRFLRGQLAPQAFLEQASDSGQQTEAHAYVGLKAALEGRRDEAIAHLTWVKERGDRTHTEYGLALAELGRLQAGISAPAP